jgi:hypothetical protein
VKFSPRALQTAALLAFAAAAAAVVGCSSSSTPAPAPTASPTPTAIPTPTASPTASPSPNPSTSPIFTFASTGGTGTITAGASGTGTLTSGAAAVNGVSVTSTWGANTSITAIAMTAQLANNNGDITTNSIAFPGFTVATAVDNTGVALTGSWTVVDYLKITATPVTTFTQTPGITVTIGAPATIAGKTACSYFSLGGNITAPVWQQSINGTPSGGTTITFTAQTLPPPNTVNVGNGSNQVPYLALACK